MLNMAIHKETGLLIAGDLELTLEDIQALVKIRNLLMDAELPFDLSHTHISIKNTELGIDTSICLEEIEDMAMYSIPNLGRIARREDFS